MAIAHESDLRRHLDVLFPQYAGDRGALLATLTEEELKRVYKRRALECHPDRAVTGVTPRGADQFLRLREAFEALRPHAGAPGDVGAGAPEPATVAVRRPTLVAVGGAKGGIGKSTLSASTASALAAMGYAVVAVDLDLGGAGLHLFLGVRSPAHTLGQWWSDGGSDLSAALHPTGTAPLSLIAGDAAVLGATNIEHAQKQQLLGQLRRLPADFVVLDLGGDTSFDTLDFFLAADHRLVVTTGDPASVLEAYSFIKVALLRRLEQFVVADAGRPRFTPAAEARLKCFVDDSRRPGAEDVATLLADLPALDPSAAATITEVAAQCRPRLLLNLSDPATGKEVIERIRDACRRHLGIDVDLCHLVPSDPRVAHATRRITNVITAGTDGPASEAIWALAQKLARPVAAAPAPASVTAVRPTVRRRFFDPPTLFARVARIMDDSMRGAGSYGASLHACVVAADKGETAYSVAIALDSVARRAFVTDLHVWAAGLASEELEAARRGVYPHVFLGALRAETLRDYFLRGTGLSEGFSAVKDGIRRRVTFLEGLGLERLSLHAVLDLVFVDGRAETRARLDRASIGAAAVARLRPGGLLVVSGWTERDMPFAGFRRLDDGIYQARDLVRPRRSVA
jgi:flagellar biosynthesis protein FlhG